MDLAARTGTLVLRLTYSGGRKLTATVRLALERDRWSTFQASVDVAGEAAIFDIPYGSYRLTVDVARFPSQSRDLVIGSPITKARVEFDPGQMDIDAPTFGALDSRLQSLLFRSAGHLAAGPTTFTGEEFYSSLKPTLKATLLNTFAKAVATKLADGDVWDRFDRIQAIDDGSVVFICGPDVMNIDQNVGISRKRLARAGRRRPTAVFQTAEPEGYLKLEIFQPRRSTMLVANAFIGGGSVDRSPLEIGATLVNQQHLNVNYVPMSELPREHASNRDPVTLRFDAQPLDGYSFGVLGGLVGGRYSDVNRRRTARSKPPTPPGEVSREGNDKNRAQVVTPLVVNQGVIDAADEVHRMEDVLRPNEPCVYWFEINREAREGADSELFHPPEALKQADAVVRLEVTCALLAKGFVARDVPYRRDGGLERQSFAFMTRTGAHPLIVQVIHNGHPVYSKKWTMTVGALAAGDTPRQAAPLVVDAEPAPLDTSHALAAGETPRLIADATYLKRLAIQRPGPGKPIPGMNVPDFERMTTFAADARAKLNKFSRTVSPDLKAKVDWPAAWAFLRDMARWGRDTAEAVFGKRIQEAEFYAALDGLREGTYLHIDSDPGSFPWEWLYLKKVPGPAAPALGSPELNAMLEGFLGFRLRCDLLVSTDVERQGVPEVLPNDMETYVLSAVNPTADTHAAPLNYTFVKALSARQSISGAVCITKADTIRELKTTTNQLAPLHLLYVYCHHSPGTQLNDFGAKNFGDSTLYMKDKNADPLSRIDMEDSGISSFSGCAPLVLLNACGTALGNDYYPSGFIPYFTNKLNAAAVIGTIAEVNTDAAFQFAQEFIPRWLKAGTAIDALTEIRRRWLIEHGNPYGMFYSIYGNGLVRLQQPAG